MMSKVEDNRYPQESEQAFYAAHSRHGQITNGTKILEGVAHVGLLCTCGQFVVRRETPESPA
jgi:hypothetical protein